MAMPAFNTYWDLEDKERAALSRDDVTRYLDAELMTKGVLKVLPLALDEEPVITEPPTETFYMVGPVAFTSAAAADTFRKLGPVTIETKYLGGGYSNSLSVAAPIEREVTEKQLVPGHHMYEAHKGDLDRRAAVRESNSKRSKAHQEACKAQDKVLDGVWEDWHRCRRDDEGHRRVVETFLEYEKIAGDATTAVRFLAKSFSFSAIKEAAEWCGVSIPDPDVEEGMPEAPPEPPSEMPF